MHFRKMVNLNTMNTMIKSNPEISPCQCACFFVKPTFSVPWPLYVHFFAIFSLLFKWYAVPSWLIFHLLYALFFCLSLFFLWWLVLVTSLACVNLVFALKLQAILSVLAIRWVWDYSRRGYFCDVRFLYIFYVLNRRKSNKLGHRLPSIGHLHRSLHQGSWH